MKMRVVIGLAPCLIASLAFAHGDHDHEQHHVQSAHVHGLGQLELAIDGNAISVEFTLPLGDAVGFERAPRDEAERLALAELEAKLGKVETLFADPGCALADLNIELGAEEGADTHRDTRVSYVLNCDAGVPAMLNSQVFSAFPDLERVNVVVLGPSGQQSHALEPGKTEFPLR